MFFLSRFASYDARAALKLPPVGCVVSEGEIFSGMKHSQGKTHIQNGRVFDCALFWICLFSILLPLSAGRFCYRLSKTWLSCPKLKRYPKKPKPWGRKWGGPRTRSKRKERSVRKLSELNAVNASHLLQWSNKMSFHISMQYLDCSKTLLIVFILPQVSLFAKKHLLFYFKTCYILCISSLTVTICMLNLKR